MNGVTIIGRINLASTVPYHASQMYARNLTAFLLLLVKKGQLDLNLQDEIIRETLLTRGGEIVQAARARIFPVAGAGRSSPKEETVPSDFLSNLYVFILAGFVGFELIKRVSPLLHTPLMSLTNALDAIVVVAAIIIAGRHETKLSTILGPIAVAASFSNMVGGFLITDRMLRMFKTGKRRKNHEPDRHAATHRLRVHRRHRSLHSVDQVAQLAGQREARRAGGRNCRGAGRWRHARES